MRPSHLPLSQHHRLMRLRAMALVVGGGAKPRPQAEVVRFWPRLQLDEPVQWAISDELIIRLATGPAGRVILAWPTRWKVVGLQVSGHGGCPQEERLTLSGRQGGQCAGGSGGGLGGRPCRPCSRPGRHRPRRIKLCALLVSLIKPDIRGARRLENLGMSTTVTAALSHIPTTLGCAGGVFTVKLLLPINPVVQKRRTSRASEAVHRMAVPVAKADQILAFPCRRVKRGDMFMLPPPSVRPLAVVEADVLNGLN